MHDQGFGAGIDLRLGKTGEIFVVLLPVDTGTMFNRDRYRGRRFQRRHAIGYPHRLQHQASAEAAGLHAVAGAAAVEVDFVIAIVVADAGRTI